MTVKEVFNKYPNLELFNKVEVLFSTLEEYKNNNTYVQIIDDEVIVVEHNGEYIINNL